MSTPDLLAAGLCLAAGLALGAFFFGGLWWTVRATMHSPRSAILQVASLALRLGATLAGFFLVGAGDFVRVASCLVGFMIARVAVTRWVTTRRAETRGEPHAPRS